MPTTIGPSAGQSPIRGLAGLEGLKADDARKVLQGLETQVRGKGGILKLMHTTSQDRDMVFERKSWWQAIARRSSKAENTAQALKTLYRQAGMSEAQQRQLEFYLRRHDNKVGGTGLARLLDAHLRGEVADRQVRQQLPKETDVVNAFMRKEIFGTRAERREGAGFNTSDKFEQQTIKNQLSGRQDFNGNYVIGSSPNDPQRLVGISRSADPARTDFDRSKPIVIFFGGSHGSADAYACPAAQAAGPDAPGGGVNFLSVDYRGFGASGHAQVTPRSITNDAERIYRHVRDDLGFPPDKIILRGYSLGAAAAGRIHAIAELKGERLGGVVYDRPMVSAVGVARVEEGRAGAWATDLSVGDFGADRYLGVMPRSGEGALLAPVLVLTDTSDEHGAAGTAMAARHRIDTMQTGAGHDQHGEANTQFAAFLERTVAQARPAE
jgi:hypothetical protein